MTMRPTVADGIQLGVSAHNFADGKDPISEDEESLPKGPVRKADYSIGMLVFCSASDPEPVRGTKAAQSKQQTSLRGCCHLFPFQPPVYDGAHPDLRSEAPQRAGLGRQLWRQPSLPLSRCRHSSLSFKEY